MKATPWATMKTLPPGSGSGEDLRLHLGESDQTEVDCEARLAPCAFPLAPGRRWDVEVYQELLDATNYAIGGAYTCPKPKEYNPDWILWVRLRTVICQGAEIARELCRRRDEREAGR